MSFLLLSKRKRSAKTDASIENLPKGLLRLHLFECHLTDACIADLPKKIQKLHLQGCNKLTYTAIQNLRKTSLIVEV